MMMMVVMMTMLMMMMVGWVVMQPKQAPRGYQGRASANPPGMPLTIFEGG